MKAPHFTGSRYLLALLPPAVAFVLQAEFWGIIQPYVWFLFFPAVFISAWIGGLIPGILSTFVSAVIVWWYFIPPRFSFELESPMSYFSIGMFCIMGFFFSYTHALLRKANRNSESANATLRASEENLAVTLKSIGDGVIATDDQGKVTRLNTVAEELTGWTQTEAAGRPVDEVFRIINQKTHEPAIVPVAAALTDGVIHGLANDTVLISRVGKAYPIADSCAPIRGRDGRVIGAVLAFRDISSEYAAQAALRQSSARIESMFNSVTDGIIIINDLGNIESFNPGAEHMFGFSAGEVAGKNVTLLMAEPDRSEHDRHIKRYVEAGTGRIIGKEREVQALRKDGRIFPINLLVNEMRLDDRLLFIGVARDISVRKEAEEQLNTFFSISLDMLCISSADGYFKRISPAFTKTLGWSVDEILARPFIDLVHPDDRDATLREVERQVLAGESVLHFENRYRHKDGTWRILSWRSVPHGEGLMFATARDVTETKDAEQALRAAKEKAEFASRSKDSFLATMSHEIRTPLTGMLGMLELLSLTRLDAEQHANLDAAWESGRGLLRIVSDILDWSKIEEGKLELSLHPASIPQLLQEVVNTYSRVASSKDLVLRQSADVRLSPAHIVDSLRLSQVLNNFVSNALKFTQQGEVELRAELQGQHESGEKIRFSVRDTGPGISKEVQEHIFQRFRQESSDTARMYGGTGLGLAICRRLAEMMDGRIELESEPGMGATFSITLTLAVSGTPGESLRSLHLEVEQRKVKPLLKAGTSAPLVLAVDDNPVNRNLLARQIEFLGLRAESAENGVQALAMWRNGNYAVVITDCHMPEMDGYGLTREIRRIEAAESRPRLPVIAWTANALAEEAEHCAAAGMDELLVKPTSLMQLKMLLAKWLRLAVGEDSASALVLSEEEADLGTSPVDFAVLGMSVPDPSEHREVLQEFHTSIHDDYAKLIAILEHGDLVNVGRTAHRMKGSARMVGAHALADAAAAMERSAHNGVRADVFAAKDALSGAIGQFDTWLAVLENRNE